MFDVALSLVLNNEIMEARLVLSVLSPSIQDEIVEAVQRAVDAALMASNRSRTYYSNQVKVVPVTGGDFK